ncbi:hypothetical protein Rs2_02895 [Raphanus sativus]|nr:hypothetical protein Rs2_02895 [Raphanus sativus]
MSINRSQMIGKEYLSNSQGQALFVPEILDCYKDAPSRRIKLRWRDMEIVAEACYQRRHVTSEARFKESFINNDLLGHTTGSTLRRPGNAEDNGKGSKYLFRQSHSSSSLTDDAGPTCGDPEETNDKGAGVRGSCTSLSWRDGGLLDLDDEESAPLSDSLASAIRELWGINTRNNEIRR